MTLHFKSLSFCPILTKNVNRCSNENKPSEHVRSCKGVCIHSETEGKKTFCLTNNRMPFKVFTWSYMLLVIKQVLSLLKHYQNFSESFSDCKKVYSKPSSFLLVNTANSHEKLELKRNLRGEIFRPYAKFQITQIPIEITGLRSQNFTEKW